MRVVIGIAACLCVLASCSTTQPTPSASLVEPEPTLEDAGGPPRPTRILSIAEIPEINTYRDLEKVTIVTGEPGHEYSDSMETEGAYVREPEAMHGYIRSDYEELEIIGVDGRGWVKMSGRWLRADDMQDLGFGERPGIVEQAQLDQNLDNLELAGWSAVNGIVTTSYTLGPELLDRVAGAFAEPGADIQVLSAAAEVQISEDGFLAGYDVYIEFTVSGEPVSAELEYEVFDVNADIEISPPGRWAQAIPGEGGLIAFTSERDGLADIYVMRPDGSDLTRLTGLASTDANPAWSPDGLRIAFVSDREKDDFDLYMLSYTDGTVTRLTDSPGVDMSPSWSPDGGRIAFASNRDGDFDIYVLDQEGGDTTRITHNTWWDGLPSWSPDGRHIAFSSERDGNIDIYLMGSDGGEEIRLTSGTAYDSDPSWSPDGSRIAFISDRHSGTEVYVMDADGSNVQRLVWSIGSDSYRPAWSPDGNSIAFCSNRDANWEVYLMDSDGGNQIRMTVQRAPDIWIAWSPANVSVIPDFYPPAEALGWFPERMGPVSDYAHVLSGHEENRLTQRIAGAREQSDIEVVVLTVPTYAPVQDFGDYISEVYNSWNVGSDANDRGVLIVVALRDGAIRLRVGDGLRDAIPDSIASQLVDERALGSFGSGDFAAGLAEVIDGVLALDATFRAEPD